MESVRMPWHGSVLVADHVRTTAFSIDTERLSLRLPTKEGAGCCHQLFLEPEGRTMLSLDHVESVRSWSYGVSTKVSMANAKPSSLLDLVTARAARLTSSTALPMAMLNPERANIDTSLCMSPMVAISSDAMS